MKEINASDWDSYINGTGKLVVVEFWHDQCVWCKRLDPVYDAISKEYSNVIFAKFNILSSEENLEVGKRLGILGTPTIKVFCEGRETGELVGYMDKAELQKELGGIVDRAKDCVSRSTEVKT